MGVAELRYTGTVGMLMEAALAPSTHSAYARIQDQLATFLRRPSRAGLFPVSVEEVVEFLGSRFDSGCSAATLATAASAIAYGHKTAGYTDPTAVFQVKQLLAGARRLRPSRDERLALSLEELVKLCNALHSLNILPMEKAAFRAIFTLSFFAMLRPGEVVMGSNAAHTMRLRHVDLKTGVLKVTIPSSKTSVLPFVVELKARPDLSVCPVGAMRDYLSIRGSSHQDQAIFINGSHRPLTCKDLTAKLRKAGSIIGLDDTRLAGHCLRISGASHAATVGMSELQLGQVGRWSSQAMKRYLRRPISLLQVTHRQ